ncbi:hypothetical protein [Amycolatopsis lexingtonensis]|uniref:hypothetical protein n=1 Tax=Amycolatopsis lexingtonensis TaxID=218822 RepID=UPI003F7144F9
MPSKATIIAAGVAAVVLAAGGLAYFLTRPAEPTTFTGGGVITLMPESPFATTRVEFGQDNACEGTEGYSDLRQGTQVAVRDASNKLVSIGKIGTGMLNPKIQRACDLNFYAPDIPIGAGPYTVTIGNRPPAVTSEKDLRSQEAYFSVGD